MEDIGRLLGYENLEKKALISGESKVVWKNVAETYEKMDRLLDSFISVGFSEVVQMSFTSQEVEKKMGYPGGDFVVLENPLHSERSVLRRHLLPELVLRARLNFHYGEDEIRLVEIGPIFSEKVSNFYEESPKGERWALACVWLPRPTDKKILWHREVDPFYEFKGMVQRLWSGFRPSPVQNLESPPFYPRRSIKMGHGFAGELHPSVVKAMDLAGRCFVGEWVVEGSWAHRKYLQPTQYPAIDMDASFIAKSSLSVGELEAVFSKAQVPFLEWVRPYDIFEPKDKEKTSRSFTFAMRYRDSSRTLTLEEAKKSHDQLVSLVIKSLSAYEVALR
jgi:phenylalanyl-tRNA synthetase beta subunit